MSTWTIKRIELPLKFTWTIARGETGKRENLYVSYRDGSFEGLGEVAFMTNCGPSIEEVERRFEHFKEQVPATINGLEEMMAVLDQCSLEDMPNLRFGLESAYIHFLAELMEGDVSGVLGIEGTQKLATCFSLPILPIQQYGDFIKQHNLQRFHALKIKIKGALASEVIHEVGKHYQRSLWIDANESFSNVDDFMLFLEQVKDHSIEIVEQPFHRKNFAAFVELKKRNQTGIAIVADESLTSGAVTQEYCQAFDGVNIKLMKAGGYFTALKQIREAKRLGLKVMLGCMLESSLAIFGAFHVAQGINYIDLDSILFLQKDPLDLVFEEDGSLMIASNQ